MTIYIHFNIYTGRAAVKLHNVAAVEAAGPGAVRIRLQFSDDGKTYSDVSHVAVSAEKE